MKSSSLRELSNINEGQKKREIPVFRVTRPYLNLLAKLRISFRVSGFFKHFEWRNAFQNA